MAEPIKFIPKTILNPRQTLPGEVIQFAKKSSPINVHALFVQAVKLENNTETVGEAVVAYEKILELDPNHAHACINLGTIYYNQLDFEQAEKLYRQATKSDPNNALAWFDLGSVLDERRELNEAIDAYRRAIKIAPTYADAHYNLALAYERYGKPSEALKHWKRYAKLDSTGPWANHARGQIRKIIGSFQASSSLKLVDRQAAKNGTLEL
jgi:tetratricopeptide (TPR) repeat protein